MQKLLTVFVVLAGLCTASVIASAQTTHTSDQAKAFVEKAAAFYKSEGKEKALAAFSDPHGQWVEGDLYLVVQTADNPKLMMLAHGANKALIGKSQIDVKDAEGKLFNQEMLDGLKTSNGVWVSYKWSNPATKKLASKKTYYLKVEDVIIAAGVYE